MYNMNVPGPGKMAAGGVAATSSGLAFTGFPVIAAVTVALFLIIGGLLLVRASRLRRLAKK